MDMYPRLVSTDGKRVLGVEMFIKKTRLSSFSFCHIKLEVNYVI